MRDYWTCSKFADWLRGTMKPYAETGEGWENWKVQAQTQHPIRYWLAEEGLDLIQNAIMWVPDRLYAIKYYINNRWVTKTHALTADPRDIKPGQWQDVGYRFLPCLFNELQDYVEIELAWQQIAWNREARAKYQTPWWGAGWFRWRVWRCPEAGVDNLKWSISLKADESWGLNPGDKGYGELTSQAKAAQEVLDLYTWWTQTYRNRPDAMYASGWTAACEKKRESGVGFLCDTKDPELKKQEQRALKLLNKIEAAYEKEEDEMLIRLVKIRRSLWT